MKNKLLLSLSGVLLLSLSSCGSTSKRASIFIYDNSDPFIASLLRGLEDNLAGYLDYEDNRQEADGKQTTQNQLIVNALDDGATSIVIVNLVDRLAASWVVEKAYSKNIPVVFTNREPLTDDINPDSSNPDYQKWASANCYYVGSDPSFEGGLQSEIAVDLFGNPEQFASSVYDKNKDGKIQVAILKGEQGHQDAERRSKSCIAGLESRGYLNKVEVVETSYCNWKSSTAKETIKSWYEAGEMENIDLIFSNNDEMAIGAIEYFKDLDNASSSSSSSSVDPALPFNERYFPIIGVDDTTRGQAAIDEGTLTGTVLNDAGKQAKIIVDIMKHLLDDKDIPSYPKNVTIDGRYYKVQGSKVTKNAK